MDRPPAEPEGPEQARGTVSAGTWGVIGSGAVVTGVGLGLWMSARGLRSEVEAAPRETRADLDALIALEEKGTFRTRLGGVLTAVGGAALAYGLYRGITERRRTPADRGAVVLTPVPIEHGAALVLTLGMP